jgi:hypothetical protein
LVREDSEEPGTHPIRVTARVELLIPFDQRTLDQIRSRISIARHVKCVRMQYVPIPANQESVRVPVPVEHVVDDLSVGTLGGECHGSNIGKVSVHGRVGDPSRGAHPGAEHAAPGSSGDGFSR